MAPLAKAPSPGKSVSPALAALVAILVAAFALGVYFVNDFADREAEQDLQLWQQRLAIVAESRVREASAWLNRHLGSIEELAGDSTIQLYVSELAAGDPYGVGDAQRGYVYSLLSVEADRSGFYLERAIDAVEANVNRPKRAGLGVFSAEGRLLVGTNGLPFFQPAHWPRDGSSFITLGPVLADNTPLLLFGAPIVAGEGVSGATSGVIGWLVGARPLDDGFLATLDQPGAVETTAETYVIQRAGDKVRMLTPVQAGGRRLEDRSDPAASSAAQAPGAFVQKQNYAGQLTITTARDFSAPVDWVLIRSILASEAMAAVNADRQTRITSLSLAGVTIMVLLFLVWRLGTSARLQAAHDAQARLARDNAALSDFMRAIANAQTSATAAVDNQMVVRFANDLMGQLTSLGREELQDRRLDAAFDTSIASVLRAGVAAACAGEMSQSDLKISLNRDQRSWRVDFVPLPKTEGNHGAEALLVMNDISDLETAHARIEFTLRQLVATLTQLIDARDPWSRHHSVRVATVATAIGAELGWNPIQMETVRIAGQLVNLGKIFVPTEILTKQGSLSDDELALVRESMRKSINLTSKLQFRGPVGETLAQIRAHWDGSGDPAGLAGKDILPTARVLSVANAFVGMVSARAHREALGFDKAMDLLQDNAGSLYERAVVAALGSVLENKGGRSKWAHFTQTITDNSEEDDLSVLAVEAALPLEKGS